MEKTVWIKTTKYSTLFRRILNTYTEHVEISIDKQRYTGADIPTLLTTWCTNKAIKRTHNFRLVRDGHELFGFHDGPANLWAAYSELPFVEALRRERILRYEVVPSQPSVVSTFREKIGKLIRKLFVA
jgi:hypothetical protein